MYCPKHDDDMELDSVEVKKYKIIIVRVFVAADKKMYLQTK